MNGNKTDVVRIVSVIMAFLNGIALLLSSGYSLYIRHSFRKIFEEMGTELPAISQRFLNTHWMIWILTTFSLLVILVIKERISRKWIPMILNGVFFLLLIIYWTIFSTAMLVPVMNITQQLHNG